MYNPPIDIQGTFAVIHRMKKKTKNKKLGHQYAHFQQKLNKVTILVSALLLSFHRYPFTDNL